GGQTGTITSNPAGLSISTTGGSISLGGNVTALAHTITADRFIGNADFATSSLSASFALTALTASFAMNGGGSGTSLVTGSTYPITASWANRANLLTASWSGSGQVITPGIPSNALDNDTWLKIKMANFPNDYGVNRYGQTRSLNKILNNKP